MVNHDHYHLSMLDIEKNNCSNTPIKVPIKLHNNPNISTKFCKNPLHSKENMGNNVILNLHQVGRDLVEIQIQIIFSIPLKTLGRFPFLKWIRKTNMACYLF